jgi:uncharacterized OB-fold protein
VIERARVVDGVPRLVGGRCESCNHTTYPRRTRCPACRRGAVTEAEFGPEATVEGSATLFVSTDEAEAPYAVGMVQVADGPKLLARIDGADAGEQVRLIVDEEAGAFWFAAANGEAA